MLTDVKYNPISNLYSFHSSHCSVQRWNSRRSQIPNGRVNSLLLPIVSPSLSLVNTRFNRVLTSFNDSEGETIGELTQPVASRRLAGG